MFEPTQPLDISFEDESDQDSGPVAYVRVTQAAEGIGRRYPVRQGTNIIGRDPNCEICIPSKKLSKQHAAIEVEGDIHYVHDMKSRNRSRRGKMFLTPNVRYELSDNCELTFGDVTVCYELKLAEVKDDGSETEPDSDTGSPMMFAETGPIGDHVISSGSKNPAQPSDEVLAADSMDGDDLPGTLLYNDPSPSGAKHAVDSDQETDDGGTNGKDVQPMLILPDSEEGGSLNIPAHHHPHRLADSSESPDIGQGFLTRAAINDSVSDVEATLLLPDEDTDGPSPKRNSGSDANCESTLLYSSDGSDTEGKGTQRFSPTRATKEDATTVNLMDEAATLAYDTTEGGDGEGVGETEPTQAYLQDERATLLYDHNDEADGETGRDAEATQAYPQDVGTATDDVATQAYGLDDAATQVYGTSDDMATQAYGDAKEKDWSPGDDGDTQAYGIAENDTEENVLTPGRNGEDATMVYEVGDEPTQAYGADTEAATIPFATDDGNGEEPTQAYVMEEGEAAKSEDPTPSSLTSNRLAGEEPTVAYAMDEEETVNDENSARNYVANELTGEERTVAYAMDDGTGDETDDEKEYPMQVQPTRPHPVTEVVSPSQRSPTTLGSRLPHLHDVGKQASSKDRQPAQLKKKVLFVEEVQTFQQSSAQSSEQSTEPESVSDSFATLPSDVSKEAAAASTRTVRIERVVQNVPKTPPPPPSEPELTPAKGGQRGWARRSVTQRTDTVQTTVQKTVQDAQAEVPAKAESANVGDPSADDAGTTQAAKARGGARKGRGRPKSTETTAAAVENITVREKVDREAAEPKSEKTRGRLSRGRGRSQATSVAVEKEPVLVESESAMEVDQPEEKKERRVSKERSTPSSRRRTSIVKTTAEDSGTSEKTTALVLQHTTTMGKDAVRGAEAAAPTPVVMFTGFINKSLEKMVAKLGGRMTTSIDECTHLVTERVRRTVKFLGCLCHGKHIVQPAWLEACEKAKQFIDHEPFNVKDAEAEEKFGFDLQRSLRLARGQSVLTGYRVFTSAKCTPEPSQMKEIVRCAGGEPLTTFPNKPTDHTVVVVDPEKDAATVKRCGKLGIACVSAEFILSGVIQQTLNANKYLLSGNLGPPVESDVPAAEPSTPASTTNKPVSFRSGTKRKTTDEPSVPRGKRRR